MTDNRQRRSLICRMAGNIAAGAVTQHWDPVALADRALSIAIAIEARVDRALAAADAEQQRRRDDQS